MIRVGVIGYGYWGPNLVRNFVECPDSDVVVVCDSNPARLALLQRRYPQVEVVQEVEALLQRADLDAVVIATPASTHFELAMRALKAGKHVLVEKPLTETSEQAQQLVAMARQQQRLLMVDHTFIFTPAVQRIKQLMDAGELGDAYYYDSVRVNLGLFQQDVNVIHDLAVHDFAILNYLFDAEFHTVSASGVSHVPGRAENMAFVTLYGKDRFIAHINVNWMAPVKVRRVMIGASRRMVVYDDIEATEKIRLYDAGVDLADEDPKQQAKLLYRMGDVLIPNLPAVEALAQMVSHFCRCIQDGQTPVTDGVFGQRVVTLLEGATQSMAAHGQPVTLRT
ncbi:Gfo/Idh/MocA family protein [Leeia sp.]|uniref:Gfo/Idh/MocA family protein n=1 Tax=Leeia sp. TaxID=2884678 RepID=UPI0035AE97D2